MVIYLHITRHSFTLKIVLLTVSPATFNHFDTDELDRWTFSHPNNKQSGAKWSVSK